MTNVTDGEGGSGSEPHSSGDPPAGDPSPPDAGDPAAEDPSPSGAGAPAAGDPRPCGECIVVATRNPHKMQEIRELLCGVPWGLVSPGEMGVEPAPEDEQVEVEGSFEGNALSKARHYHGRTGCFTLADDSGLCVDALGGEPGVRSKRFAPVELVEELGRTEANNRHLLRLLASVDDAGRGAHFRCVVAAFDGERHRTWEGRVEGRIAHEQRGTEGFGYDPLFVVAEVGKTFGELPPETKSSMSHRARAFRQVRRWLEAVAAGCAPHSSSGAPRREAGGE